MIIKKIPTGPLSANCYCVTGNNNEAVLIDVGGADYPLLSYIEENNLVVKAILLTHGHFDHVGGVAEMKKRTGAKVYIHEYDKELTSSREKSLANWVSDRYFTPFEADVLFSGDNEIIEAGIKFTVLHMPGHTRGSSCFIGENNIFCGDALFRMSVGRSDTYGGDPVIQRAALAQFKELKKDYNLFCGHGEDTTLYFELENNPYLF